jgi:hypothetical protein
VELPPHTRLWFDTRNIAALQDDETERAAAIEVKSRAIAVLTQFNYDPDSVVKAVETGDLNLLTHNGPVVDMKGGAVPLARPPSQHFDPTTGQQIVKPDGNQSGARPLAGTGNSQPSNNGAASNGKTFTPNNSGQKI